MGLPCPLLVQPGFGLPQRIFPDRRPSGDRHELNTSERASASFRGGLPRRIVAVRGSKTTSALFPLPLCMCVRVLFLRLGIRCLGWMLVYNT